MTSKDTKKKGSPQALTVEGRRLSVHAIGNVGNRMIAGYNMDDPAYGAAYRKQLLGSTSCRNILTIRDMKVTGTYSCQKRWCWECNRYYSVKKRLAYAPSIQELHKPYKSDINNPNNLHFLTITIRTTTHEQLEQRYVELQKVWRIIYNSAKKKKRPDFSGTRKLECTANLIKGLDPSGEKGKEHFTYHAHYHILIHGRDNAEFIRDEWLRLNGEKAHAKAQDIRPFDGNVAEIVKYIAKPSHGKDPLMNKEYAKATGWIYACLRGKRSFFTFGKIKKASKEKQEAFNEENAEDLEEFNGDKQNIREDKTWAEGGQFKYERKKTNYISAEGRALMDKKDIDFDNPSHFCQKKWKAIKSFEGTKKSDLQADRVVKAAKAARRNHLHSKLPSSQQNGGPEEPDGSEVWALFNGFLLPVQVNEAISER